MVRSGGTWTVLPFTGSDKYWCDVSTSQDRARLEIVLRVFLRGFDGGIFVATSV